VKYSQSYIHIWLLGGGGPLSGLRFAQGGLRAESRDAIIDRTSHPFREKKEENVDEEWRGQGLFPCVRARGVGLRGKGDALIEGHEVAAEKIQSG